MAAGGLATLLWLAAPGNADDTADPNGAIKPVPQARSMAIQILSANYGHNGAHDNCTVTQSVRASCNGRSRCVLDVGDELCRPPNPLPGELIFTLTVQYKCTPRVAARAVHADKPFRLTIDCGSNMR